MAKIVIEGRPYDIARYSIGAMRKAAPYIDAINSGASLDTIEGLMENGCNIIAILAIGLTKIDSALTAEALEDIFTASDIQTLGSTLREILEEAGLTPKGEATAPAEIAPAGA
jgi:hypothetical protein